MFSMNRGGAAKQVWSGLCLLAGVSWAVSDETGTSYSLEAVELQTPSYSYLSCPTSSSKPGDAGTMPSMAEEKTVFMDLRLGDGPPCLVAVERLDKEGQTVYRVYLDTNGNRSLADETPCETAQDPQYRNGRMQYTPPLTVPVVYRLPSGEVKRDYRFRLGFYPSTANQPQNRIFNYAQIRVLQGWGGQVAFGGKTCRITLSDGDGDACISMKHTYSRDHVRLEGTSGTSFHADQYLTQCVEVDGVFYNLDVQPDGAKVTVSKYTGPVGSIALFASDGKNRPANLSELSLRGPMLSVSSSGQDPVPVSRDLPCGNYYVSYSIGTSSPKAYFRLPKAICVEADTAMRIDCGGPVVINGTISQESGDETTLVVSVSTATAAEHNYQPVGARQAGKIDVLGADGVSQGSANMEYG